MTKKRQETVKRPPGSVEAGLLSGSIVSCIHKAVPSFTFGHLEMSLE